MKPRKPIPRGQAPRRKTPIRSGGSPSVMPGRRARLRQKPASERFTEEERRRRTAVREAVIRRDRVCVLNPVTANRYLVRADQLGVEHRCGGDRETMHHLDPNGGYTFENLVLACEEAARWRGW